MENHDNTQMLQFHYKVLSGKLLQLMHFKARQRLLNLKEQQLWKEYCEKEFGSSTQISLDSHVTGTDISVPLIKPKHNKSLNHEKLTSQHPSELHPNYHPTFPKRVIYQKSVISKQHGRPQKAEFTKFEVIKVSKKNSTDKDRTSNQNCKITAFEVQASQQSNRYHESLLQAKETPRHKIQQKFSKQIKQGPRHLPPKDFTVSRPSPKAVSFLLPQKLQEERAIAWKGYLKSSPPHIKDQSKTPNMCKFTQTNIITKDACENTTNNGISSVIYNYSKVKEGGKNKKNIVNESMQINKNDLLTEVNVDKVVNSVLEDLFTDTVEELSRIESKEMNKNITVQLDTMWSHLCDLECKEEEIRRKWKSLHYKDLWTHSHQQYLSPISNSLPVALPTIILNKGEKNELKNNEIQKDSYCQHCDYCRQSLENAAEKPVMFTKSSSVPKVDSETPAYLCPKRKLHLGKHAIKAIEDYHHYQFSFKYITRDLANIRLQTAVNMIPDALLEDILVDIAAELTDAPGDIVTKLYEQEFHPENL